MPVSSTVEGDCTGNELSFDMDIDQELQLHALGQRPPVEGQESSPVKSSSTKSSGCTGNARAINHDHIGAAVPQIPVSIDTQKHRKLHIGKLVCCFAAIDNMCSLRD